MKEKLRYKAQDVAERIEPILLVGTSFFTFALIIIHSLKINVSGKTEYSWLFLFFSWLITKILTYIQPEDKTVIH